MSKVNKPPISLSRLVRYISAKVLLLFMLKSYLFYLNFGVFIVFVLGYWIIRRTRLL